MDGIIHTNKFVVKINVYRNATLNPVAEANLKPVSASENQRDGGL